MYMVEFGDFKVLCPTLLHQSDSLTFYLNLLLYQPKICGLFASIIEAWKARETEKVSWRNEFDLHVSVAVISHCHSAPVGVLF